MPSNRQQAKRDLKWTRYVDRIDKVAGFMPCFCGKDCHSLPRAVIPLGYIARRAVTRRR